MQTFLPLPDLRGSVRCLDDARLGKQRVEAFQILLALRDPWALRERRWRIQRGLLADQPLGEGWATHPATRMWRGHGPALRAYYNAAIREWKARGFRNTLRLARVGPAPALPAWFGRDDVHASHRRLLLAKNPGWYSRLGWREKPGGEYVWPL